MTVKDAKETFARLMAVSRDRSLTAGERSKLRTASQLIRHARRTTAATNRGTVKNVGAGRRLRKSTRSRVDRKRNGGTGTLIYESITRIEGTKGKDSQFAGEKFFHNFKRPYPRMYGLPDGSLLIKSK